MIRFRRLLPLKELRRAIAAFLPALSGQRRSLLAAAALTLIATGLQLLRPWPIQYLFDHVLFAGEKGGGHGALPLLCAAVVVLGFAVGQVTVLRATVLARIGRKVATRVRRRLFHHLHRLALPFHLSRRSGDLLVRLMGDVDMVRDVLLLSWLSFLERGVLLVGAAVVMALLDPWLALVALLPIPFLLVGLGRSSRKLKGVTRKQRRKRGETAAFAAETLRQIRLVKAYAAEERVMRLFAAEARLGERAGGKAARIAAGMTRLAETLTGAGLALVLFTGAQRVLSGSLTAGELLVVVSYARSLYKPLRKLARESARLTKAVACSSRILEVLEIEPEDDARGDPVQGLDGSIRFEDVSFAYGRRPALRGLSFELEPGALAVVSGPNGAGKSTVLGLLLGLFRPDRGRILLDGRPLDRLRLGEYRDRLAYVPQQTLLFGTTIRENIAFGAVDASSDAIEAGARAVGAHGFIAALEEGYETVLGENGATLSGGEARRLMLARAALRQADILLLDEPLAGLDPGARAAVAGAIRAIARGRTTIVVHHGCDELLQPDVRLWLEDGRMISNPAEALAS